ERGIKYLLKKQFDNGSWEAVTLWNDSGLISKDFKSKSITTTFAIKAIYKWSNIKFNRNEKILLFYILLLYFLT
ncbi:MAG: hypothetical protein ACFFDN_23440, partial [Candidatus Hodarchaeota archaeon]